MLLSAMQQINTSMLASFLLFPKTFSFHSLLSQLHLTVLFVLFVHYMLMPAGIGVKLQIMIDRLGFLLDLIPKQQIQGTEKNYDLFLE